jgi:PAS domain S-box-containing protein
MGSSGSFEALVALANAVSDAVYVWKPLGEMLWVNRAFERQTGMKLEDFQFKNADNPFIHPDDLPGVVQALERFVASPDQISAPIENRFFDAWGRQRHIHSVVHKVEFAGELALMCVSQVDEGRVVAEDAADFKALVETADDGILKLSPEGRITYANRRMQDLAGQSSIALAKLSLPDLFAAPLREAIARAVEAAAAGVPTAVSGQLLAGKHVDVRLSPLGVSDTATAVLAIARDRETERELELSQRRLALATAATSDAIWEWNLDTNQAYYSPRWYEILGYGNRSMPMTFDAWRGLCHPEDLQLAVDTITAAVAAPGNKGYEVEFRMRASDGNYRWILSRGAVVERDDQGKPRTLAGTNTDITERKKAAETLAENERRLRSLTNNVPTVMLYQLVVDAHDKRRFTYVSAGVERLHGHTPEELLADSSVLYNQVHPDDMWLLRAAHDASRRELSKFEVEVRIRLAGTIRWALFRSSPRRLPDGGTVWDGVEIDVTAAHQEEAERRRLEDGLRQAQKMESVGRLAGGVAHDFNNMLTAIKGNISMAELAMPAGGAIREHLQEAQRAADSAANLTRQLLAFSRKQVLMPQVLSLNDVAKRMHKMLGRVLGEDVELVLELGEFLEPVRIDPGQVEQILVNLAVNARDAMPEGGRLTLSTENLVLDEAMAERLQVASGHCVLLSVGDTGTGMSAEVKSRLFEPFFTTKGVGKGTGLGLAMVYGAVKQAGGGIEVYSEPGEGSVFRMYLPAVEGSVQSLPPTTPTPLPVGSETVLVVEDEEVVRTLARNVLERLGYTVRTFGNANEVLANIGVLAEPVDLLLTDLVMPGMSGRELAERLLGIRPELRVLYTSGYTEDMAVHRGIAERGIAFLPKPYSMQSLAQRVREVLDAEPDI